MRINLSCSRVTHAIDDCDEVIRLLTQLHSEFSEAPELVDMAAPNGAVLTIGLGAGLSVLSLTPDPKHPPYLVSKGDPNAAGYLWFDYGGSDTELPLSQAVPLASALLAARQFCETGGQPTAVAWETV